MSTHVRTALAVIALAAASFLPAGATYGFGAFTSDSALEPSGFSNLISNPNDFWSWDDNTIKYSFDSSFTSNSQIRNQIRLAFMQWDDARGTADGSNYSYIREASSQPFGDIRSIAVHEIGHVLGLHHPNQAHDQGRNYRQGGGGSLSTTADNLNEVMRSYINPGDYNQTLSHDELDAYRYMYGSDDLQFTEVGSGGDIVIEAASLSSGNIWAQAGPTTGFYRNGGNHLQGVNSKTGTVTFNSTSSTPMGFKTLGINWDFDNLSGANTASFEVRTRGANNPTPISRYDGFPPNRFQNYNSGPIGGANNKEDVLHTWDNPISGPFPGLVHVGLELDVWDWTVVSAQVVDSFGNKTNAPVVSFHDWSNTVTSASATAEPVVADDGIFRFQTFGEDKILGRGIRIVNSLRSPALITKIGVAKVGDLKLQLEDLNQETMNRLMEEQRMEFFDIDPMTLDNGQPLLLLFDGEPGEFPGPVLQLDRPDLLETELFLFARTVNMQNEVRIGNFGLMGREPFTARLGEGLDGDYNGNGRVEQSDLDLVLLNWKKPSNPIPFGWVHQLPTGLIDQAELDRVVANWGHGPVAPKSVPEPTGIVILVIGVLLAITATRK